MSSKKIPSLLPVIDILINDGNLIKNWMQFCDALEIDCAYVAEWEIDYNNTRMGVYELFRNILHTWISQNGKPKTIISLCQHLKRIECICVAETLEDDPEVENLASLSLPEWPLCFNLTKLNRDFVGRSEELCELEEICRTNSEKTVLISGLGGIGKTELVRKFAQDSFMKGHISCTWFNGETQETLYQSLMNLALKLGISTILQETKQPKKFTEIAQDVLSVVGENEISKSWLVIVDNVDDLNTDLETFLQMLSTVPDTVAILTSRNVGVFEEGMHHITLEKLTNTDALEFVARTLKIQEEEEVQKVQELCDKLENHPLAMNQAIAYILQQKVKSAKGKAYRISDYLEEYSLKAKELLEFKLSKISSPSVAATFITWDISILKLQESYEDDGEKACQILNRLAFLNPTSISVAFIWKLLGPLLIPLGSYAEDVINAPFTSESTGPADSNDEFEYLVDSQETREVWDKKLTTSIELLKQYSLIKCEDFVVSVHRLVQEVTRIKCAMNKFDEILIVELINTVTADFEAYNQTEMNHAISIWNFAFENEKIIKRDSGKSIIRVSVILDTMGMYPEMKQFTEKAYKKMIKVLGQNHIETLILYELLARALFRNGNSIASLQIYETVWQKQKEMFGEEGYLTLITAHNMCEVLLELGKLDEAMQVANQLVCSYVSKDDQTRIMNSKLLTAKIMIERGDIDGAIEMSEQVLKWQEKELGPLHISTLKTKHNIAVCSHNQGRYFEAQKKWEELVESNMKMLGEEHPDTLTTIQWLVDCLNNLGEIEKALEMLIKLVDSQEKVFGPHDPATLNSQHNLAVCFQQRGQLAEAKVRFKNVIEIRKKVLGEEHLDTVNSIYCLSQNLIKNGEIHEALELDNQLVDCLTRVVGPLHPQTLEANYAVAMCFHEQKKHSEAKVIFEKVIESRKKVCGEDHLDTLQSIYMLALSLEQLGEERIALDMLNKLLIREKRVLRENDPLVSYTHDAIKSISSSLAEKHKYLPFSFNLVRVFYVLTNLSATLSYEQLFILNIMRR